jgi:hypothetical protein
VNLNRDHCVAIRNVIAFRKLDVQLCIAHGFYLNAVDDNELIRAFVDAGGITGRVPITDRSSGVRGKNAKQSVGTVSQGSDPESVGLSGQ